MPEFTTYTRQYASAMLSAVGAHLFRMRWPTFSSHWSLVLTASRLLQNRI